MPAGVLLSLAILSEVVATVFLRFTDGFTKLAPSIVVVVGYALSFWLLALILKDLDIGFVYAVWSGAGTALIAAVGIFAFGESRDRAEDRLDRGDHPRRDRAQPRGRVLVSPADAARDERAPPATGCWPPPRPSCAATARGR